MAMGVLKGAAAFSILVTAFRRVSQALVSMIGTFSEFEFVMAKVKAVSGASSDEFKQLSNSAQELGRSTFFTASQVANLQLNLSKLGFTTQEILAMQEATINLSIATGSDLARAATVAGSAVRGFQLDASEATRVIDVMAVAFSSSALDIEKWQTSMTKVAPIAAMAGFTIEETTAIMAKLSDTGIEASIAGTSLRNIFLKMQNPTSELSRKVGHTVSSLDSMLQVFKDMQEEGTDLGDVLTFMDVRQVAAFGTMLEGADDIKALRDELMNAEGAGQSMADTVGDTLRGSILKVQSAFQGLSIAIVQRFGGALSKMFIKLSKWLNVLAKSEGTLIKVWAQIKLGIKFIASYVIGAKLTVLWNGFMATSFVGIGAGAGLATKAIALLRGGLALLKTAIITTGIGFFVILLGEWVAGLMSAASAMEDLTFIEKQMAEGMIGVNTEIALVDANLAKLLKTRASMNKMLTKEGELIDKSKVATAEYNRHKKTEENTIRDLNGVMKVYGDEQIKINDSNEAIIDSTKRLTSAMKDKALVGLYEDLDKSIMKTQVSGNIIKDEFDKLKEGVLGSSDKSLDRAIDDLTINAGIIYKGADHHRAELRGVLRRLLESYDMDIISFKKVMNIRFGWEGESVGGKSGYYNQMVEELRQNIEEQTVTPFEELFKGVEAPEVISNKEEEAIYELQTKINEAKKAFSLKNITNEEEQQLGILQAQKDGIVAYQNQYKEGDVQYEIAAAKLIEVDKKIQDTKFKQKSTAIEKERTSDKIAAKQAVIDGTTNAEDLFSALNTIDENQNQKLLDNALKFGKDKRDIQNKIDTQTIKTELDNFKESERIATEAHNKEKLDLDLSLANEEMTAIEHKARMLSLEAEFLTNMVKLYGDYGQSHVDIDNKITQNTIDTKEQQKAALREYISALGDLGGFMQDVAGEEDKMNAVRKAGIIITQAASTAEQIMALMTTLNTLATKAEIALAPAKVAADGVKTASTTMLAGATFMKAIADGIRGMPWWAQLIGIVGIVAAIKSAKSSISSAFKNPTGGGGDDPSPSGGGGGGQMSLMTFGGQHTTVGSTDGYAQGGMVHGNSHAQGGEKFSVGGRVVELEGGEAVINKRSTSMFRSQLSAMNYAGGGVSFADGGVTNVPSFAQTQFQVDGQRGIQGAMSQRSKVVVVEADITKSQNRVSAIEAEASF
jgi:TP901 family phage tail tape measure protein